MSDSELYKATHIQNGTAFISIKQKNSNYATDMDLVKQEEAVAKGALTIAHSKDFLCIDITENSVGPPTDKNEEIESESLTNAAELTVNIQNEKSERRKLTVRDMVGAKQQQKRFAKQISRQEQAPLQPMRPMFTLYGPNQSQGPPAPEYPQSIRYPSGPPPGQENPPGSGYESQGYRHGQEEVNYDKKYPNQPGYSVDPELLIYDPKTRNNFVRLVMLIVFLMFLTTAILLAIVLVIPDLKLFFQEVDIILIAIPTLALVLTTEYALTTTEWGKRPPWNYVSLIITVMAITLIAAKVTAEFRTAIILYAFIATAVVVFVCFILAFSSFDFTSYHLYIVGISIAMTVLGIIIIFVMKVMGSVMKPVLIAILFAGTLTQVVVLTVELQMILGGKTVAIKESDYTIVAIMVYLSILDIFVKIVQLLGIRDED